MRNLLLTLIKKNCSLSINKLKFKQTSISLECNKIYEELIDSEQFEVLADKLVYEKIKN